MAASTGCGNYSHDAPIKRYTLPSTLRSHLRVQEVAASLSFTALDEKIDRGLSTVVNDWKALVPYLLEMHRHLSAPGRRNDLRKGAPSGLTWTSWVDSKRCKLGRSLRTIQNLLRGKTETSQTRQALALARAKLGVRTDLLVPDSPMAVASEMARLVLAMRDDPQSTRLRHRLELLAETFLHLTGQRRPQVESDPIESVSSQVARTTVETTVSSLVEFRAMDTAHIVSALQEERRRIDTAIAALTGITPTPVQPKKRRGRMSAAGRARIAAAQKARWAKFKRSKIKRVK